MPPVQSLLCMLPRITCNSLSLYNLKQDGSILPATLKFFPLRPYINRKEGMVFALLRQNDQNCHVRKERTMSKNGSKMKFSSALLVALVVLVGAGSMQAGPAGLTAAESDGYQQW